MSYVGHVRVRYRREIVVRVQGRACPDLGHFSWQWCPTTWSPRPNYRLECVKYHILERFVKCDGLK